MASALLARTSENRRDRNLRRRRVRRDQRQFGTLGYARLGLVVAAQGPQSLERQFRTEVGVKPIIAA